MFLQRLPTTYLNKLCLSQIPFVTVTAANGDIGTGDIVVYLSQVTTTAFTLTLHNKNTTRDTSLAFHYMAISMG